MPTSPAVLRRILCLSPCSPTNISWLTVSLPAACTAVRYELWAAEASAGPGGRVISTVRLTMAAGTTESVEPVRGVAKSIRCLRRALATPSPESLFLVPRALHGTLPLLRLSPNAGGNSGLSAAATARILSRTRPVLGCPYDKPHEVFA
ncbi:hypothetical protein K466DRAFT_592414 [Polyporus arcularius HHB13444]|uniref:Uncharacterized protein n=1 Tax=Polyporus arcularius HHB13444 TaxID=1314778 RepID=A0A5C3NQQ7_9APHY|nr:hypothetical protein K466DRAFT_592414 [Polyporus arcularius HHB13444]